MPKLFKNLLVLLLPVCALVLELLPFSFPFVSTPGPNIRYKTATSYWAPFYVLNVSGPITLILTAALIIFAVICVFILKKGYKHLFTVSFVTAIMSLLAMLYSVFAWIDKFTIISVVIFLLLCGECLLVYFSYRKNN